MQNLARGMTWLSLLLNHWWGFKPWAMALSLRWTLRGALLAGLEFSWPYYRKNQQGQSLSQCCGRDPGDLLSVGGETGPSKPFDLCRCQRDCLPLGQYVVSMVITQLNVHVGTSPVLLHLVILGHILAAKCIWQLYSCSINHSSWQLLGLT